MYGCDFKCVTLQHNLGIDIFDIEVKRSMVWMPEGLVDVKATLAQEMAWCRQVTSHYLNQCWAKMTSVAIWRHYVIMR